jgi:hypothetical protein
LFLSLGPPSSPTAPLEITALGPHSVMVEWGAPESDGGAPLEGYKVAVRDAKRHMWMEVGRVAADVQKLKVQELAVSIYPLMTSQKEFEGLMPV